MREWWDVYAKSAVVCLGVGLATLGLARQLTPLIHDRALRLGSAFAALQVAAIFILSIYLLARRAHYRIMEGIYEQLRPSIRERVLALAFAGESWSSVVPKRGAARRVLEESLAHTLAEVRGPGRDRLAQFAIGQGFAGQWVKAAAAPSTDERKRAIALLGFLRWQAGVATIEAALHDKHPGVRAEAGRALVASGEESEVDKVFRAVLREPLLTRALLASDLQRHASYLVTGTVPDVLREGSRFERVRCLELMVGWRRALPSFDVEPWLNGDRDLLTWPLVLALLPYVPVNDSIEDHLQSALSDADLDVRCAAARAAGLLKMERLIPALSAALNQNRQLAISAANALTQMGAAGERCLRQMVSGPDRAAATAAMEALEHLAVGLR